MNMQQSLGKQNSNLNPLREYNESVDKMRLFFDARLDFDKLISKFENAISKDEELKKHSFEHYLLRMIVEFRDSVKDPKNSSKELLVKLEELLNNPEIRMGELGKRIGIQVKELMEDFHIITELKNLMEDKNKLMANIPIAKQLCSKLKNPKVKERLFARLAIIEKLYFELRTINECLLDLESLNSSSIDVSVLLEKIEIYLKGETKSKETHFGLERYPSFSYRTKIYSDPNVNNLRIISGFCYRAQDQIKFIQSLIAGIKKDIVNGVWETKDNFSLFYKNIEIYSKMLGEGFKNKYYSKSMIFSKSKIGEQPFEWIELLEKMIEGIRNSIPKKDIALANARNSLVNILSKRKESIVNSVSAVLNQANSLVSAEDIKQEILYELRAVIKKVDRIINKLWAQRRKKFFEFKKAVEKEFDEAANIMQRFWTDYNLNEEIVSNIPRIRRLIDFRKHTASTVPHLRKSIISGELKIPIMLAFNSARMQELAESVIEREKETLSKKDEAVKLANEGISRLKGNIVSMNQFISWVKSIRIGITDFDFEQMENKIKSFEGVSYVRN